MGAETSSLPNKAPRAISVCHHKSSLLWFFLEMLNLALGATSRAAGDRHGHSSETGTALL